MRLVKYLAHSGVASRRASEKLIAAGRVAVDGATVTDPARDVEGTGRVTVDGRDVAPEGREVWMLNKPLHVVSTASEPGRRRAVVELIDSSRRLYPVGRLDADSTGLILIANDGELANRLTHPRYEVPKTYLVKLQRPPGEGQLRRLREGPELDDGPTNPAEVSRAGRSHDRGDDHRGSQPPGPAHGRGRRQPGRDAAADRLRLAAPRRPAAGRGAAADALGAATALEGCGGDGRRRHQMSGASEPERGADRVFAVRGAVQADRNDRESILSSADELIRELMRRNELVPERMISCILTCTDDLDAEFPAVAARGAGLTAVPLLCTREMDVPGSMERVIRAMVHYYAPAEHEPQHTYLGAARQLRSDLHSAQ